MLPLPRLSEPKSSPAARAQTIDLTGKLAFIQLTGSESTIRQLEHGRHWMRDLAGATDPAPDPNSKLRIPVATAAGKQAAATERQAPDRAS